MTHNKHTQLKNFSVEDQVMLFTKNLRDARLKKKLSQKYTELFAVVNLVEPQSYRLRLSLTWRIHLVFHLSIKTLSQKWSYRFFLENDSRRERREVRSWRSTSSLKTHDLMRKYHKRTRYDLVTRKGKRSRLQEDWRHSGWVDFEYSLTNRDHTTTRLNIRKEKVTTIIYYDYWSHSVRWIMFCFQHSAFWTRDKPFLWHHSFSYSFSAWTALKHIKFHLDASLALKQKCDVMRKIRRHCKNQSCCSKSLFQSGFRKQCSSKFENKQIDFSYKSVLKQ